MNICNAIKEKKLIHTYGKLAKIQSPESYHEFQCKEDVESWGRKIYSSWAKTHQSIYACTQQYTVGSVLHAIDPVGMYLGNGYNAINQYLRGGEEEDIPIRIHTHISNLIIAISSAPVIDQKLILYRQVPKEMLDAMISINKEMHPYQEKGFMSTSLLKTCCANYCGNSPYMLKIYVNNSNPIHAIYADIINERDEAELLLPPDLCMKMINYPYQDENTGKIIYEVELFRTCIQKE